MLISIKCESEFVLSLDDYIHILGKPSAYMEYRSYCLEVVKQLIGINDILWIELKQHYDVCDCRTKTKVKVEWREERHVKDTLPAASGQDIPKLNERATGGTDQELC